MCIGNLIDIVKLLYKELILIIYESYSPTLDTWELLSFCTHPTKRFSQLLVLYPQLPEVGTIDSTSMHLSGFLDTFQKQQTCSDVGFNKTTKVARLSSFVCSQNFLDKKNLAKYSQLLCLVYIEMSIELNLLFYWIFSWILSQESTGEPSSLWHFCFLGWFVVLSSAKSTFPASFTTEDVLVGGGGSGYRMKIRQFQKLDQRKGVL